MYLESEVHVACVVGEKEGREVAESAVALTLSFSCNLPEKGKRWTTKVEERKNDGASGLANL